MDPRNSIISKGRAPGQTDALELLASSMAAPPRSNVSELLMQNTDPAILQLWRIIKKRIWVVASFVLVFVTLTTIVSLRMTPTYMASTRLLISPESNEIFGLKDSGVTGSEGADYDSSIQLESQVRILGSDALALKVIEALHLDQNPAFRGRPAAPRKNDAFSSGLQSDSEETSRLLAQFHTDLKVLNIPQTRLVDIHFMSPDPRLAAQIANQLANTYIEQNFRAKYDSTMQASDWLARQIADLKLKVESSQENLVRYQKQSGILGLDEKQNIVVSKLDELNKDLTAAQADRIQKEANYKSISSGDAALVSTLAPSPILDKLRAQELDYKAQYAQLKTQFGPSYPKVVELQNQLAATEAALHAEIARTIAKARTEYETALQREKMLQQALDAQKQQANQLNEAAIEYGQLKREADTNRQLYDGLLQKLKEAGISAGLRSGNIRVVDIARPPLSPAKPDIPRNTLLALLFGLIGGMGLALLMENVDTTVRTPDQVELLTALSPLGAIPDDHSLRQVQRGVTKLLPSAKSAVELVTYSRPKSQVSEAYRALRTSLLLAGTGTPPGVILVTSPLPQEGKTTTAINTAIVLAQKGERVLLVDADMRRPAIHVRFDLPATKGLSNLLAKRATAADVIQTTSVPNLMVIAAGPPPPHPAELLASEAMKEQLAQWRQQFDRVIIDTPPALSVTDPVVLSVSVDAVVLVIRAAKTTKGALRRCRDVLGHVSANVLGVVINAVNMTAHDSYYYSYYYYYGSGSSGSYYKEEPEARGGTKA